MSNYGFGGGLDLPKPKSTDEKKHEVQDVELRQAVKAGSELGFVSREPSTRLKPGPKPTEPKGQVSIPGPKRVVDEFREFCRSRNITLWQGLELLMREHKGRG